MKQYLCLVHGAKEIVQGTKDGTVTKVKGEDLRNVHVLNQPGVTYAIAVDRDGKILAIGPDSEIMEAYSKDQFENVFDMKGAVIMPGFIDGHTHPVWAGDRVNEFALKLAGASYMEVHEAGGGINFTVQKTRNATEEDLLKDFLAIADGMLSCGTTTVEAKSGYGLDIETELKMLNVLQKAKAITPLEISPTYCGAHAVPRGKTSEEATEDIVNNHIPILKQRMKQGLSVENVDVFCESTVFPPDQTRRILSTAVKELGLNINFHGDELSWTASAELAASLNAHAVSHLEEISPEGRKALAKCGTVAVVLPTTAYILRLTPPPVRNMIDDDVVVALGSDFNPNAYCFSMPMVIHLACVLMHMSMEEALLAATINSAASIGRGHSHGALHVGRVADLVIVSAPSWHHLIYRIACHNSLIKAVFKNGKVVFGSI